MSNKASKIHSILQAAIDRCASNEASNQLEEFSTHTSGYAEPGYNNPESGIILTGNWNNVTRYDYETRESVKLSDFPERLAKIFSKRYGAELEWSDEWCACSDCGKLVRTQADSYGWKRYYFESDGENICGDCVKKDPANYLESLEGKDRQAITIDVDPEKHGYAKLAEELQNGLYGGQCADPATIAKNLKEKDVNRFLFRIENVGQFDLTFSVFVHEDEYKLASDGPLETDDKDPAVALEAGLRAAAHAPQAPAGQITVNTITGDGLCITKHVTPQDFIDGKALEK